MKNLRLPVIAWAISLFFLAQLSFSSAPVADDYCMAYGSYNFGVLDSLKYLNLNWTPSASYIYFLGFWALPFSSSVIAIIMGFTSLLISTVLLLAISRKLLSFLNPISYLQASSVLLIGFTSSIAFVQYSVFQKSLSDALFSPRDILNDWFQAHLLQSRDGQVLLWMYSTPLTSTRVVLAALIIFYVLQSSTLETKKQERKTFLMELLFLILGISWGLTTESLTLILYILFRNIKSPELLRFNWRVLFILTLSISGVIVNYFSRGSQYRSGFIAQKPLKDHFLLFGANLWQMCWILGTTVLIGWLSARYIGTYATLNWKEFPEVIRKNLFALGAIAIFTQLAIGTLAYSSAYHWATCIWIIYICSVVEFLYFRRDRKANKKSSLVLKFVFLVYIIFLIATLAMTTNSAEERKVAMNMRSQDSIEANKPIVRVVSPKDNHGNVFGTDLHASSITIVPFRGYVTNGAATCYSGLPIGF